MLHSALTYEALSLNELKDLTTRYPGSVSHTDQDGNLPIHIAIINNHSCEVISALSELCPSSLKVDNHCGYLPIHLACFMNSGLEVIESMANLYPESLLIKENSSRQGVPSSSLPIHLSCSNAESSAETILFLAKRSPESLRIQDGYGYLPIHYICEQRSKAAIIPILVDMYPEGLLVGEKNSALPLHSAIFNSFWSKSLLPCDEIVYLATRCPESLMKYDRMGDLPLHCVLGRTNKINMKIVHHFVRLCPRSVHAKRKGLGLSTNRETALGMVQYKSSQLYRILLNSSPNDLSEALHIENYRTLNWTARMPSIILILKLSKASNLISNPWLKIIRTSLSLFSTHLLGIKSKKQPRAIEVLSHIHKRMNLDTEDELGLVENTEASEKVYFLANDSLGYALFRNILSFV